MKPRLRAEFEIAIYQPAQPLAEDVASPRILCQGRAHETDYEAQDDHHTSHRTLWIGALPA